MYSSSDVKQNYEKALSKIFEGSADELTSILSMLYCELDKFNSIQNNECTQTIRLCIFYARYMIAYIKCDLDELANLLSEADAINLAIKPLLQLRSQIRNKNINLNTIKEVVDLTEKAEGIWHCEFNMIVALAFDHLEKFEKAKIYYLKAHHQYKIIDAHNKSFKAKYNAFIMDTKVNPKRKYLSEYFSFISSLVDLKEFNLLGLNYLNIAREYELLGANDSALHFCNKAIEILSKHESNGLHFFLALVLRCKIYISLDKKSQALADYELALTASFAEIISALKIIQTFLASEEGQSNEIDNSVEQASYTWKDRLNNFKHHLGFKEPQEAASLTTLEEKLILFISDQPRDKFEIIEYLYEKNMDIIYSENRFKVLLSRLRKKRPHIIELINNKYQLSESNSNLLEFSFKQKRKLS